MVVFNFRQAGGVFSFHEIFFSNFQTYKNESSILVSNNTIHDVQHNLGLSFQKLLISRNIFASVNREQSGC